MFEGTPFCDIHSVTSTVVSSLWHYNFLYQCWETGGNTWQTAKSQITGVGRERDRVCLVPSDPPFDGEFPGYTLTGKSDWI